MNNQLVKINLILEALKSEAIKMKEIFSGSIVLSKRKFLRKKFMIDPNIDATLENTGKSMMNLEKTARDSLNLIVGEYKTKYFQIDEMIGQFAHILQAGQQIHTWNIGIINGSKIVLNKEQLKKITHEYNQLLGNLQSEMGNFDKIIEELLEIKKESIISTISNIPTKFNAKMSVPTKNMPSRPQGIYLPYLLANYITKFEYPNDKKIHEDISILKIEIEKYLENMDAAKTFIHSLDELMNSKSLVECEELLAKAIDELKNVTATLEKFNNLVAKFGANVDKVRKEQLQKLLEEAKKKELQESIHRYEIGYPDRISISHADKLIMSNYSKLPLYNKEPMIR